MHYGKEEVSAVSRKRTLVVSSVQEVPVKHVVVNKVVEESVQEGYLQRLSKGQSSGIQQLEEVRTILTPSCILADSDA